MVGQIAPPKIVKWCCFVEKCEEPCQLWPVIFNRNDHVIAVLQVMSIVGMVCIQCTYAKCYKGSSVTTPSPIQPQFCEVKNRPSKSVKHISPQAVFTWEDGNHLLKLAKFLPWFPQIFPAVLADLNNLEWWDIPMVRIGVTISNSPQIFSLVQYYRPDLLLVGGLDHFYTFGYVWKWGIPPIIAI